MKKGIVFLLIVLALLMVVRVQQATSVVIPYCNEVRNENYSGPCVTTMINGVITGD